MSNWKPISELDLLMEIGRGLSRMTNDQIQFWDRIKINPEKWTEPQFGAKGGGFWVVAMDGNLVVWYNDIEEGFNVSAFSNRGKIDEYWANQDELQWSIKK